MKVDQTRASSGGRSAQATRVAAGRTSVRDGAELRGASTSALIYQALRTDIVSLRRMPGDPIVEKDIGSQFGVSRTPVREAILRLAAEKLIEIVPQFGTFVARIPLDLLPEALVIRKALENVTVRAAAERATRAQITALRANLHLQRDAVAEGDLDGFRQIDDAFHGAIAEAAGYPGIWSVVQGVKIQVDRYCHLTLPKPGRMTRLVREHAAICKAIADHDPDRAAEKLFEHVDGIMTGIDVPENIGELVLPR
jgi:DNA-binding GntR family transcriptional regulator